MYVCECTGMLAVALGPLLSSYLEKLLDFMLLSGLSQTLVDALERVCVHVPALAAQVQIKLLDMVTLILTKPFLPK